MFNIPEKENGEIAISGRELHEALEVKTAYKDWFPRMLKYRFEENIDFTAIAQKRATAQGNITHFVDHALTLDTAKEIATHVYEEDKTTLLIQQDGSNYKLNTVIINESSL